MKTEIPKPDDQYLKTGRRLKEVFGNNEHFEERVALKETLRNEFTKAFELSQDRLRVSERFFNRFINSNFRPKTPIFDHKDFFRRNENFVIVSQPYGIDEFELSRWTQESNASFVIANEWGYYYPGKAKLFFVEFTPQAKAKMDKRINQK